MKLLFHHRLGSRRAAFCAFTLAEAMIAMAIFSLVVTAMVATQLFGLRTSTLGTNKLSATAGSLKALDQIRDQIREAQLIQIGNCTNGNPATFTAIPDTSVAQGSALEIYPTTNMTSYVIYYLDTSTATNYLKQYTYAAGSATIWTLAGYITNHIIFDAEDFQGNVLTNSLQNNRVYGMTLQFSQWEFSSGEKYSGTNFYQLRTHVTRRAID